MTSLQPLTIIATSDSICPFCFIGLKKLESAIAASPLTNPNSSSRIFETKIQFKPFQLDPTLPEDKPLSKKEVYHKKFGKERFDAMEVMMKQRGKEVGINFDYNGPIRSTITSHRLLNHAYKTGGYQLQHSLLSLLFPFYFEQRGDPGDPVSLAELSTKAKVFESEGKALEFIKSNQGLDQVMTEFGEARSKGITGVPHFEILTDSKDGRMLKAEIPGAQESETFKAVFKQIAEKSGKLEVNGKGEVC